MQLPKKLFVKIERGDSDYFVADTNVVALVQMGEKIKIGVYQLVEITQAEGVAKIGAR